ncbi:hypothetical protein AWZ03_000377 [Drosophila navojoa]|uniref:Uncharacterized protein n=1 Tax=Drosophila navojoa TaxID=7232 RepID=A0A484C2F7_DRONA|nr:uncharacterized protein LOC115565764 [Drosophila navojoa]TDG53562.1 hypothetical protein AWZ03_000377 [Drosophila navojoa]
MNSESSEHRENLIGSKSLEPIGDNMNKKSKRKGARFSFRTLAHMVVMLQKRLVHAKSMAEYVDVTDDVAYWRALALSRGEEIDRFINIIELQKKRIDTLENDLGTLVNLAQETQKMLADITPEKPSEKSRQDETV